MMTGAFKATYGFAYLCCVLFIIFFLVLLVFQGAVTKEIGICEWGLCLWSGGGGA